MITAIDIALEPDATMIRHVEAANARLRKVFPQGYALDATHRWHITVVQRYVRTAELDEIYAAVAVSRGEKSTAWTLRAYKCAYVVWDGAGLTGILIEPTADFIAFQQKLIDAVAPFRCDGKRGRIITTPGLSQYQPADDRLCGALVPASSGAKFEPHVTVGVAPPSRRWSPSRSTRSISRRRRCRFTSSAISARPGRNSRPGSSRPEPSACGAQCAVA